MIVTTTKRFPVDTYPMVDVEAGVMIEDLLDGQNPQGTLEEVVAAGTMMITTAMMTSLLVAAEAVAMIGDVRQPSCPQDMIC